jgi:hypothetical protein
MAISNHIPNNKTTKSPDIKKIILFFSIFLLYVVLRGYTWSNTVLLEDTDSLFYLRNIKDFLAFDLEKIIDMDPDTTPFYPFWGALFTLPGWSVETGARLTSLFFSCLLFVACLGIGRQITTTFENSLGLLVLTFSPLLISLSFSVLTEPSYIATVYLGFWLFLTQYRNPRLWKSGLLGVIFGMAFLNRVEGLLYLGLIPLLQGSYLFLRQTHYQGIKHFVKWIAVFVIFFSSLAVPQIWRVSHKAGFFLLNGRQIHQRILGNPSDKSVTEKMFGLDYSPKEVNLLYLKNHPETLKRIKSNTSVVDYCKRFILKSDTLYKNTLGNMIGPLGLVFFAFGLLSFYESGQRFLIFFFLTFIGINLLPELVTPQVVNEVVTRHIAIIFPMIAILEGIGIVYLVNRLLANHHSQALQGRILAFICLFFLLSASALSLRSVVSFPPPYNHEYRPAELKEPVAILMQKAANDLHQTSVVTSERGYIAYFANSKRVFLPYTNYEGLVKYCQLNHVDFLYLKHALVKEYPFFQAFMQEIPPPHFDLLYRAIDTHRGNIELYSFNSTIQAF